MHLHFVNYETSREGNVSTYAPYATSPSVSDTPSLYKSHSNTSPSHLVTDMKSRLEEYDPSRYDLYGAYRCSTYAQFRSPPTDATANADRYAWMATDKFFSDKWGSLWHPIDNRSERDDSIFNVTLPSVPGVSPSSTCDAIGQPETVHCNVMDMPSGTSTINPDAHACWSNGNRHWCDVAGFGNCQVSIGWGVDKPRPEISGDRLTSAIQKHLRGKQGEDCAGQVEDTPSMCAVGGPSKHCTVGWKFCMKRLGVNCV
jgi:hypothetical protein